MAWKLFTKSAPSAGRQRSRQPAPAASPYAYRSRRAEPTKVPKRSHWPERAGLAILLIAVLASVINITRLSTEPKVLSLAGSDNQLFLRPLNTYQTAAGRQLSNSLWNRNKLTVDTSEISRQLKNQFPELASVNVTIPLLAHRPIVHIAPSRPALIIESRNGAFVVDSTGKALARHSGLPAINKLKLPILNDQSGLDIRLNQQVLPADDINFIQTILGQLTAKQYAAESLTLPPAAHELDVKLAGQPYFVKFNLQSDDPRGQAGTFLAAVATLKRQNITPAQYIDVRVDGRAYYQ